LSKFITNCLYNRYKLLPPSVLKICNLDKNIHLKTSLRWKIPSRLYYYSLSSEGVSNSYTRDFEVKVAKGEVEVSVVETI